MEKKKIVGLVMRSVGYGTDPNILRPMLSEFIRGEFIVKQGRGRDSLALYGIIENITIPDEKILSITIHCQQLYEQVIGCEANLNIETTKWKKITPPPGGIVINPDWFRHQKRRRRLKLASEQTDERCWLCSHEDPINIRLFRVMLVKMFLEESQDREQTLLRRIRRKLF
jgi:hypothetical protein